MGQTLLYRLFGLGKVPRRMLPALEQEGIVLIDEGISGSLLFRNFRAPGRRYSRKFSWFTGSVVLTQKRFAAFTWYPYFNPIINVPLDDKRLKELDCSVKGEGTLCIRFDPSAFHEGWSGSIECRFSTPQARLYLEWIKKKTA
jgi:hypothetical protein